MRIVVVFALFFSLLFSFEVGLDMLTSDKQNSIYSNNVRLVIARDYIDKGNYDKAEVLLNHILNLDKDHKKANLLMQEIRKYQDIASRL